MWAQHGHVSCNEARSLTMAEQERLCLETDLGAPPLKLDTRKKCTVGPTTKCNAWRGQRELTMKAPSKFHVPWQQRSVQTICRMPRDCVDLNCKVSRENVDTLIGFEETSSVQLESHVCL